MSYLSFVGVLTKACISKPFSSREHFGHLPSPNKQVVNWRIMTNLEKENLLPNHQFGFRICLGAADLLTSLNHQWLSCSNTGGAV